jgi:hypothetical protein
MVSFFFPPSFFDYYILLFLLFALKFSLSLTCFFDLSHVHSMSRRWDPRQTTKNNAGIGMAGFGGIWAVVWMIPYD